MEKVNLFSKEDVVNQKIQVKVRGKIENGRYQILGIVRQHYLRSDISCGSSLCFEDKCGEINKKCSRSLLSSKVTHYLLPITDVLMDFLSILELSEFNSIIFLQSLLNRLPKSHRSRIVKMIKTSEKNSIFFPNLFFKDSYVVRGSESLEDYEKNSVYIFAKWYYEHLGGQKPVVIITNNDDSFIEKYENKRLEVFVLSLKSYLTKFWPSLIKAFEIYNSIQKETLIGENEISIESFSDYYKMDVLESGIMSGKYFSGSLRVNKHHSHLEAFITHPLTGEDILIPGKFNRNRSIDRDKVVVALLPKSNWKSKMNTLGGGNENTNKQFIWEHFTDVLPTGRVIGVLARNWREYIVSIDETEDSTRIENKFQSTLVVPFDRRIPKIRILTSQIKTLKRHRFVVCIDNWPVSSNYPNGHFVRVLGKIGDLQTEIDSLLLENDISVLPFSQGILQELPNPSSWTPEVSSSRKDLRKSHLVMSIDPEGCTDVDDALSLRKLTNGNIELGVHIADVTHFVLPESLTDIEASKRATTVYLADRRYDMLPDVLSSNLCSLLANVDRYAVSLLWELNPQNPHEVISTWYGRTLIRNSYQMTYEKAQNIIDGKPNVIQTKSEKDYKLLTQTLRLLTRVADAIQVYRERDGALTLESASEVQFEFEASNIEDLKPKEHLKIHDTVAECMIFANHWVAKKISKSFPSNSLLRRHPAPQKENFDELRVAAKSRDWRIETWSNKALADSLNSCKDFSDPYVNFLLRSLATLAMVQALYFSTGSESLENWTHYGLALTHYTHFTSPIRRYADIIVHRMLLAALDNQDWWSNTSEKKNYITNAQLIELTKHLNDKNRSAQNAQRVSTQLFQTLYFKNKQPDDPKCIVEAIIFSIRGNGFLVYVPRYGLKGAVYMQNEERQILWFDDKLGPTWQEGLLWQQDSTTLFVEHLSGTQRYKLFDHLTITIQLKGSEAHLHSLSFYPLAPKPMKSLHSGEINFLKELQESQSNFFSIYGQQEDIHLKKETVEDKSVYHLFSKLKNIAIQISE